MSLMSSAILNQDLRRRRDSITAILLKADSKMSLAEAREKALSFILREDPLEGPLLDQVIEKFQRVLSAAGIGSVEHPRELGKDIDRG